MDEIWKQHCENDAVLESYSRSMQLLAEKGWGSWLDDSSNQSRVAWCRHFYCGYYIDDRASWESKLTTRNKKISKYHDLDDSVGAVNLTVERVRLLDVGSCYNPFAAFDETKTFALDLAPAVGVSFKTRSVKFLK